MRIFVPKENQNVEMRVAMLPNTAAKLVKLGAAVEIEAGLGTTVNAPDEEYVTAGAKTATERTAALAGADIVLRVRKPPIEEVAQLKRGGIHLSYLDPFNELELVQALAAAGVTAISMEMIPRSTIAQTMDALSSQASLAGYVAVILAANCSGHILPMMMTPAGTIRPVRVFVIGVGVAGLQAIATAKRLGAAVAAFDTRPVVEEQVRSLGARFVKIDLGETGQTEQGYAKELTPEQLERQREAMAAECAEADIVITTAQIFGRKAPRIITTAMIGQMRAGSVIVDLAIESGGNVEGAQLGAETDISGVKVLGLANLPGRVARTASQMFSNNLVNFVEHFWDREAKTFKLDLANDLLRGCVITHGGAIVNETIKQHHNL